MKIKRIASGVIFCFLFAETAFAIPVTNNIDEMLNQYIDNIYSMQSAAASADAAYKNYNAAMEASVQAETRISMDDRFIALENKKSKTWEEGMEYYSYLKAFGKPMDKDERFSYIKMRDIDPITARYSLTVSQNQKDSTRNKIKETIYDQYVSLLKLQDAIELKNKNIDELEAAVEQKTAQFAVGIISERQKNDELLNLQKANLERKQLERQKDNLIETINGIIGESLLSSDTPISDDFIGDVSLYRPLSKYKEAALSKRAEILNAKELLEDKQTTYNIIKEVYESESEPNCVDAKYELDNAIQNMESVKLDIEMEITDAYKVLNKKKREYETATESLKSAQKTYELYKAKYKSGMITKNQVEEWSLSCDNALMQMKNTKRDLWTYKMKFDFAVGIGPSISDAAVEK